ncbi:hypothetical protein C5B96_10660 [Subtercola sp. Z020]|uniref:DUF4397 domain-containing protein n=1 Tax=Subtercola sp. Z020 TaxID=2080582 RepID=UPI000CE81354|nr:DUF4397 domain-containing protein [Subtercola sp. Z020]PPF80740.1 hypothetical protein C5B96_10660 [Subtercola sp. Z020]
MAPFSRTRSTARQRLAAAMVVGAAAAGLLVGSLGVAAASAAEVTSPSVPATVSTGWLRLAHLSPDTKAVDIRLSALSGGSIVTSLSDIGYGAVSAYMALDPGTYVVAMAPTGSDFAAPVIQASVTVVAGQPLTVAAYGKNADLQAAIYHDDLSTPGTGQARVRVVQASTIVPTVSVATSTGLPIASTVAQGSATDYASVPTGPWTLDLTGGTVSSTAQVQLDPGSVSTLFVLDDASGGLALKAVLDSASAGDLPAGGIQTGGGATATQHVSTAGGSAVGSDARAAAGAAVGTGAVAGTAFAAGQPEPGSGVPTGRMLIDIVTGAICLIAAGVGVFIHRRRTRPTPSTSVDLRVADRLARVAGRGAVGASSDRPVDHADGDGAGWGDADRGSAAGHADPDGAGWGDADRGSAAGHADPDGAAWGDAERGGPDDAERGGSQPDDEAEPWRAAAYTTLRTREWR